MSIAAFKNSLIPKIKAFAGVPIIEADQTGDQPNGPHVTFKITTPYTKDRGQAEERGVMLQDKFVLSRVESFKRTISFTAYDMDNDASFDLAQAIHDWFDFYGYDQLSALNIVVMEATAVQNRDAFVLDDYERRNGFDVILRLTREINQEFDYIERIDVFDPQEPIEYAMDVNVVFSFDPNGVIDKEYTADVDMDFAFDTDGVIDKEYIGALELAAQLIKMDQPLLLAGPSKVGQAVIL